MSKKDKNKKVDKKIWLSIVALVLILVIIIGLAVYYYSQNKEKKEENTLAYTDLIKEISYNNVEKVEMTTGSTTVKVKMKNVEEEKRAVVPNTESFMELIQTKVAEGNEIELIQKPKSVLAQIPSMIFSLSGVRSYRLS